MRVFNGLCARSSNRLKNPGGLAGLAASAALRRAFSSASRSRSLAASHLSRLRPALAARLASYARWPSVSSLAGLRATGRGMAGANAAGLPVTGLPVTGLAAVGLADFATVRVAGAAVAGLGFFTGELRRSAGRSNAVRAWIKRNARAMPDEAGRRGACRAVWKALSRRKRCSVVPMRWPAWSGCAGHDLPDLVANFGFEGTIALLWDGLVPGRSGGEPEGLSRAGTISALGAARVTAFAGLDRWLDVAAGRPLFEGMRVGLAALPTARLRRKSPARCR